MPGKHNNPTISFRPSSWERALIDERADASGMYKKEFITRSRIYSNIVVVGKREYVQHIVDELRETQIVIKEIAEQIQSGNFSLSDESYRGLKEDYLAFAITMVDILNGAAYLFDKKLDSDSRHWKGKVELEEYRHVLKLDAERSGCENVD